MKNLFFAIMLMLSTAFLATLITKDKALAVETAEAPGYFISTVGENRPALAEATKCLTQAIQESSPLRASGYKDSILDISIIQTSVYGDNLVSMVVSPLGYPFLHALTNMGNQNDLGTAICLKTVKHIDKVISSIKENKDAKQILLDKRSKYIF